MPTKLLLALMMFAVQTPSIEGDWNGTLAAGAVNLRLVYHVTRDQTGQLTGTMDSVDQGAKGLKIASVAIEGTHVRFQLTVPPAAFEGQLSADGSQIDGAWMQGGASLPLVLKRGALAARKRPQEPVPPYPYKEEKVSYENKAAGIHLAATLTLPAAAAPAPAVVLITGSGAEDRDESLFGHKPFLVLADYLTRHGIAVLRADDRGVGGSSGNVTTSTSEDFAGDALTGVQYLESRPEIDHARIGLIGHSEGGLVAAIAAAHSSSVAFIVMMAGPGLPGDEVLYLQAAAIIKASGGTDAVVAANRAIQERFIGIVKSESEPAAAAAKLQEAADALTAQAPESRATMRAQAAQANTPWFRYFLTHDPRPILSAVKCPVLAINGELDLQVPAKEDLDAIGAALKSGGNTHVTLLPEPGLNHLFQTAKTGLPAEYGEIEETISPGALDAIEQWIRKTVAR